MIKINSLKQQLLFFILSSIIVGMGVLFYFSYSNLKRNIDISQKNLYSQKIDNIIYLIDQKYQKLQKTGMIESYEEIFKKGTIETIKDVFIKNDKNVYAYIIDKDNLFLLHPKYNKKNSSLYENDENFLNILKLKTGDFDLANAKNDRWTIFKYYKPWNWIIGYRVHKDVKYQELNKFRNDFIISLILVLIVISLIIVFIVKRTLFPIISLTNVSKEITSGNLNVDIKIICANELKELSKNFEIMRNKIVEDIDKLKNQEKEIKGFNQKLQKEVEERTEDLVETNDELESSIENLKKMQKELIESEKLAGLGSLVAGVAHEINTPVGIGLTGSSHLLYLCEDINNKYKNNMMSEEDFEVYLKSSTDLINVVSSNLKRTAEIVKNFKQVAVDQTSEQKRIFRVKEYIKGVLISIDSITKQKDIEFKIECLDDLEIISYPGFFAQIITNFVANSVIHGFNKKEKGVISFKIKSDGTYLYFDYFDDGKGIPEKNLSKIYEPFFSTEKESGGSGLGLNIVYNLVTNNLKGSIDCKSEIDKGTTFTIKIPL